MSRLLPKDQIIPRWYPFAFSVFFFNFQQVSNEDMREFQTSDYIRLLHIGVRDSIIMFISWYVFCVICIFHHAYFCMYVVVDWLIMITWYYAYAPGIYDDVYHMDPMRLTSFETTRWRLTVLTWWKISTDCILLDKDRKTHQKGKNTHTHYIRHTIRWWGQYVFFRKLPKKSS